MNLKLLTHYHTIPTFDDPEKEAFRKHCGKRVRFGLGTFWPHPMQGTDKSCYVVEIKGLIVLRVAWRVMG